MNVYDILRNGRYVRQTIASTLAQAQRWCDEYLPGCVARFSYRLTD